MFFYYSNRSIHLSDRIAVHAEFAGPAAQDNPVFNVIKRGIKISDTHWTMAAHEWLVLGHEQLTDRQKALLV